MNDDAVTLAEMDAPSANTAHDAPHIVHATECLAGGTLGFLVRVLRELDALGVKQTLIFSRRPDTPKDVEQQFPPSVKLVEIPAARGLHIKFISGLVSALHDAVRAQPTLAVHLHSSKAGFVGRLALGVVRNGAQLLYSPHGLAFLNRRRRLSSAVYWVLERFAGFVNCQPVGCSHGEAQLLEDVTGRVAFVLENPVAEEFFKVERKPSEPPIVLSVGRACEQKAPEVFAELAVHFHIQEYPARFIWAGSGESDREARVKAAGGCITGWVPAEEVCRLMSEATIYVQTSRWEGMPLSVIQAMATGLPCVVTDVVGNRDAIRHGHTGLVATTTEELASHLELLFKHADLRERLGSTARAEARARFGPETFRKSLAALYGLAQQTPQSSVPATNPSEHNDLRLVTAA
ncbi:MAG TPA: glycosyltransferase [Burkholderiaceae bacterium]|nr:glycosyltransferase [Burkholderiaceae bacterium]